jgi:hypothetical protein
MELESHDRVAKGRTGKSWNLRRRWVLARSPEGKNIAARRITRVVGLLGRLHIADNKGLTCKLDEVLFGAWVAHPNQGSEDKVCLLVS